MPIRFRTSISTRMLKPAAPSGGTTAATIETVGGGTGSCGSSGLPGLTPAQAPGGSVRCPGALRAPITPSPHGSAIARCWSAAMSTRWSSVAAEVLPGTRVHTSDFVFDPLHYLSLLELTNAWIRRLPWPAGCCRRCSAISARLLEARMGKAGKREYVQVLRLIESFPRRCSRRHIGGAGARVIPTDAAYSWWLLRMKRANLWPIPTSRGRPARTPEVVAPEDTRSCWPII